MKDYYLLGIFIVFVVLLIVVCSCLLSSHSDKELSIFTIYHTKNSVNEITIYVEPFALNGSQYRCVLDINGNPVDDDGQFYVDRNIWKSTNELSNVIYSHWSNKIKITEEAVL